MFTLPQKRTPTREKLQKGFSLIELMVVVAIVGILISVASPQLQVWVLRGRQAEAKIALSAVYTRHRQFYSQYHAFHMAMNAIGYNNSGLEYYSVQNCTNTNSWSGTVVGYFGPSNDTWVTGSKYLGNAGWSCVGQVYSACSAVGNSPQTLGILALGQLQRGINADVWFINHNKQLANCRIGLR